MKIQVILPVDRYNAGKIIYGQRNIFRYLDAPYALQQEAGIYEVPCLGKADNAKAKTHKNPTRDPLLPWGDTPTGVYAPTHPVWLDKKTQLGEAWIPIIGISGDALRAVKNGRTGLGIHAGRGSDKLKPTYGCLRMLAKDFYRMIAYINEDPIDLEITEGNI